MIENLLPFLTASVLLTLSPGPDIMYVLVQSLSNGIRAGILTTMGLVSGILIHTSLVAFGVSAILKESETVYLIIKILGACYLFYLAYRVWMSKVEFSVQTNSGLKPEGLALFKRGFIMNVINPKVTIFFLAFFPGFIWDPTGNTIYQFYLLGGLFMIQAFMIFGIVAILAGKIAMYLNQHSDAGIIFKWLQIFVFVGIGIFILL
ncbi:MAG TPA: LysE family translocator [Gillisia sp.]|nr:LysE family translocator [Gillisia sp.]